MASDNPYQSPKTQSAKAPKRSGGRLMVGVLLLIGMIPASAAAFFCCCLAGAAVVERPDQIGDGETAGMITGSIGGLLTLVLMLWGGIAMIRRSKQPPSA